MTGPREELALAELEALQRLDEAERHWKAGRYVAFEAAKRLALAARVDVARLEVLAGEHDHA